MSESRVKISARTTMVLEDSDKESKNKITFYFKDENHEETSVMLVTFPQNPSSTLEYVMKYDEAKKHWEVEIERASNCGEGFYITTAKEIGHVDNINATILDKGFIALKNGHYQPVNPTASLKGELQHYLLKINGELVKVKNPDPKELKEEDRYITIYTPPGYDPKRKKPYPLQITLDGSTYLFPMQMNVVLDNLTAQKEIDTPVTVFMTPCSGPPKKDKKGLGLVMPVGYGLSMRLKEYCANPDFSDRLASMPVILKSAFNVSLDREDITLWGVSAGGLCVSYTALLHPDVFGNVVAQSPMAWNIPIQNGENWREGIVDTEVDGRDITWETATAPLPVEEGEHKEYITQMVKSGYDDISKRDLDSSQPIKFYFDAGEREQKYDAKEGSANLVKATELFALALEQKNHVVVGNKVHLVPGGHHNMTWMYDNADILRKMHPSAPDVDMEKKHFSMAQISAGLSLVIRTEEKPSEPEVVSVATKLTEKIPKSSVKPNVVHNSVPRKHP